MNDCPTITDRQAQEFLVTSLSLGGECDRALLTAVVPELWALSRYSVTCGSSIEVYLNTRLKALELLMGCAARQFDSRDGLYESFQTGEGSNRADGFSQAQASNQGFRVNDSSSCAKYDDFSKAKMRSGSQRDSKSCSRDTSFSIYTDQGGGKNKVTANADRASSNAVTVKNSSSSTGSSTGGSSRAGCNWTFSTEDGDGLGQKQHATAVLAQASLGASSNYSTSNWAHHMEDGSASKQVDLRTGKSNRGYERFGQTDNKAKSETCSYFTAAVASRSEGISESRGADDSSAFRDEHAHAAGEGMSFSKADARGDVAAQGSSKSHDDSDSKRDSSRWIKQIGDTLKMSQRFANLKALHALTVENLTYVHSLARARTSPLWTNGICQVIRDGYCDIKLWMLSTQGYRYAVVHPNPVFQCCDKQAAGRRCNCG